MSITLDYSVTPQMEDNFLESAFRLQVADQTKHPEGIVVLLPGTDSDGRNWVNDPVWQKFAKDNNLALIGVYYRGEGLSYDVPDQGSGKALDQALGYFADTLRDPQFRQLPLLLYGHSQGAQFAFNYVGWRPERVLAFASIKPGGYAVVPQTASFLVPGLLIAGEHDESSRIRTAVSAFLDTRGKDTKWCFLYEKDSGHEIGKIADFTRSYFESVLHPEKDKGIWLDPESGRMSKNPDGRQIPMGWVPDNKIARLWQQIHKPARLQALLQLPPKPSLSMVLNVLKQGEILACENSQQVSNTIQFSLKSADSVTIKSVKVSGVGFSLQTDGKQQALPMECRVNFAPKQLPWGPRRGVLHMEAQVNGLDAEPLEIDLLGIVQGVAESNPSSLYLGVVKSGVTIEKDIKLASRSGKIVVRSITVPNSDQFQFRQSEQQDGLVLHMQWQSGPRLGIVYNTIQVQLSSPEEGFLHIPVIGFVEKPQPKASLSTLIVPNIY
jgi:pimeloyl-ACP methyl ester carboxylesterase